MAIAISRRHLKSKKGFKRDYDDNEGFQIVADAQAAHSSRIAGQIYGRGIEEAPGHVQSRKAEYREVSREWHYCLGFGVALEPRCIREIVNTEEKLHESRPKDLCIDSSIVIEKKGANNLVLGREEAKRKNLQDEYHELDNWVRMEGEYRSLKKRKRRV